MGDPFPFLMSDAWRLFRRAFEARVRGAGITGPQWRLLGVISRNPGLSQSAAADLIEVEPITLSRMVDRLEDAGLVARHAVAGDRRTRALFLTDRAAPLVETMRDQVMAVVEDAFAGFSAAERQAFIACVEKLRANLSRKDME